VGYCIEFALRAGTLQAVVTGKANDVFARFIARDIADEASRHAAKRLLIDVRRLRDRLGSLGTLARLPARGAKPRRIAVVDAKEFDTWYAFPELSVRKRGAQMRRFPDAGTALRWLSEPSDRLS
jgi:hypothetical protein